MSQSRMTQQEFRALVGHKPSEKRGGKGPRTARGHAKSEWLERFSATPARTEAETADLDAQRALFDVHEPVKIVIRLPLPPSSNHHWRMFMLQGTPRMILSAEGRAYREAVVIAWADHNGGNAPPPLTGRLRLCVQLHFPDARRTDIANREKPLSDALTSAGVWQDDQQLDDVRIRRGGIHRGMGYADIWIETIEGS